MNEAVSLRDLYERYSDHVQFLVIYIREAHPDDGWQMEPTGYNDPQTIEERRELAGTCEATMEYGIRTYVDEIHDPVMTAYVAWPERLYLIGIDGKVMYAGGPGPFEFSPSELKEALDGMLQQLLQGGDE